MIRALLRFIRDVIIGSDRKSPEPPAMKRGDIHSYIDGRLSDQTRWYDSRARQNKIAFMLLSITAIAASALVPVTISVGSENWVPAVFGGIATLVTSLLAVLKSQENWLHYRSTAEQLKKERYFYEMSAGPYAPEVLSPRQPRPRIAEEELVERVEDLISEEHGAWRQRRSGREGTAE